MEGEQQGGSKIRRRLKVATQRNSGWRGIVSLCNTFFPSWAINMDPCYPDPLHMSISFDVLGHPALLNISPSKADRLRAVGSGCRAMALPPHAPVYLWLKKFFLFEAKHRECIPGGLTAHVTGMIWLHTTLAKFCNYHQQGLPERHEAVHWLRQLVS